jgi:hypothetical protein
MTSTPRSSGRSRQERGCRCGGEQVCGDRTGGIVDPFGHVWYVGTHVEDVPPAEMEKRAAAAMAAKK